MANKRIRKKRWTQSDGALTCTLCGKALRPGEKDHCVGRRGAVCRRCLTAGYLMTVCRQEDDFTEKEEEASSLTVPTPQELMTRLDRVIAGQEEAKRAVALAMWKQRLRAEGDTDVPASHLLLYGPSGCGKTFLARQAAEMAGLPSIVFDATTLSEAGYRGRDAADILKEYGEAAEDHPHRGYGVIILDEADKLAAKGSRERQAYCRGTQHSLLKVLEGGCGDPDSAGLLFVLCGAFHGIGEHTVSVGPIGFLRKEEKPPRPKIGPEDFVSFGMERELMGRVADLAPVLPLTEEDLVHILLDKEGSALKIYQKFFANRGVTLRLSDEGAGEIARRALALGTGARALKSELDKVMEPLMFRLAAGELTGEVILDGAGLRDVSAAAESDAVSHQK